MSCLPGQMDRMGETRFRVVLCILLLSVKMSRSMWPDEEKIGIFQVQTCLVLRVVRGRHLCHFRLQLLEGRRFILPGRICQEDVQKIRRSCEKKRGWKKQKTHPTSRATAASLPGGSAHQMRHWTGACTHTHTERELKVCLYSRTRIRPH